MKNPLAFIIAFSYVHYRRGIPQNKKMQYQDLFSKNSHACIMFNVMFVGLFFLWLNWPSVIFIIGGLSVMVVYYVTKGSYSNNKKYFFRTTAQFLRTYINK